ncbi:STAS-like domain-containing protein [Klebsiella michiganensis]|uniref:STAS-like domain-containing protein n=1 Tax=Klebsiella michiganensis TaxID=1134687 RepID=UPI0027D362DC|nr:STAS-like domain-containing protein [Klebsiella michiganensis]MDQ4328815.1 STAS-like domain-containing protein [Klebsiella michiganensis]
MKTIYIKEFSRYPGPRYESLGENSGEKFRESYLIPAILENDEICIDFDGVFGYGSSFLEEAFGGLVRKGISINKINTLKKNLKSSDPSIVSEVISYINDALRDAK